MRPYNIRIKLIKTIGKSLRWGTNDSIIEMHTCRNPAIISTHKAENNLKLYVDKIKSLSQMYTDWLSTLSISSMN